MKKNKLSVLGMSALVLTLGFCFIGCGDPVPETSKTSHYDKIELFGDKGDWGSEWDSWEWVKLSEVVPQGIAKPLTRYSVTVEGNTDKVLSAFSLRLYGLDPWTVFKNWTDPKNISGPFIYKSVFATPGNSRIDDFNRSYLALGNIGDPPVTTQDEPEATLTNVTITVEEVATIEGAKTIKITGITLTIGTTNSDDTNGEGSVFIYTKPQFGHGHDSGLIAREVYHEPKITNGELFVNLYVCEDGYDASDESWTGSGEYYICLTFAAYNGWYDEGGGNLRYWWTNGGDTRIKYNIQNALTTLEFSQFVKE
jgi:hypothetical protein